LNKRTPEPSARRSTAAVKVLSAATWPAAGLLVLLHARGDALTGPRAFALVWTWLVALGCLGCPAFALRLLGRRLSPPAARQIGFLFTGAALLVTALIAAGQLNPPTAILYAILILPMAIAIQALNGGEVLDRERRAYERGRQDALAGQLRERTAVAAALRQFTDAELAALEREHEALGMIVEARRRDLATAPSTNGHALHALPDPRGTGRA
jgi:hypothetical protein